jgi:hypothetical protein
MSASDVIDLVRTTDPLDQAEIDAWAGSATTRAMVERILDHPLTAAPARRRRRTGTGVVAAIAVLGAGGTATAFATGIIGGPAPDAVRHHLAGLDVGMPADLRYNPDVDHARAVAATTSGALYLADTTDGGYCLEVVSDVDRPRGATCLAAAAVSAEPLQVTAPIPDSDQSPLLVGGRANDPRVVQVGVQYADGSSDSVDFGLDRSWLLEVPDGERVTALDRGLRIVALDADGAIVAREQVPPLRDDDPLGTAHDDQAPIVSRTISDGDDLTLVLGIEGRVNVSPSARLTLRYPDGTTTDVPVAADGTFHMMLPAARQDDFATRPGLLKVIAHGDVVATTPVGSVAYWRGRDG